MAQEGFSSLSFSMKESILLDRGKRVDELMSLSLEPDITIDESDGEVCLRGMLHLHGEYRPTEQEEEQEDENSGESLSSRAFFKSVEEVSLSEEGIGEISHQFPIDVTIPKERIDRLEDIDVIVQDFDYNFPDKNCLEIIAELAIHGVRSEESSVNQEQADGYEFEGERSFSFEQRRNDISELDSETFDTQTETPPFDPNQEFSEDQFDDEQEESFIPEVEEETYKEDVKRQPQVVFKASKSEDGPKWENEDLSNVSNDDSGGSYSDRYVENSQEVYGEIEEEGSTTDDSNTETNVVHQGESTETSLRESVDSIPSEAAEPLKRVGLDIESENLEELESEREKQNDVPVTSDSEASYRLDQKEETKTEEAKSNETLKKLANRVPEEEQEAERAEVVEEELDTDLDDKQVEEKTESESENALYLTKMLANNEEEEAYSKLRMCIVQDGESLDVIANRYKLEVTQIKRMNRLKDEQVSEGQILYIPVRKSSSSD
ncbi:LysM peptidoglycan-binding domain-containing protein [Salipaludibacillus daqingensis]|uniref:LysM peptidoglycan-binding domain-containing protein n=1 Tax=Salipaludibacillus daqingensis TaxID=3041001 RepID=UPI0024758FBF|nr:LysM peptidoglycan-binding domain-containing protein [Salipaludibacillus daqingensis]